MHNVRTENLAEHSLFTGIIAHALTIIGNERFGKNYNAERAAVFGLFHDASEILTGDMPTPVKYANPEINNAYKKVESVAHNRLLSLLPRDMQKNYKNILNPESEDDKNLLRLVKAADKIAAYIKCVEEEKMGNREFLRASESLIDTIKSLKCEEANTFLDEFSGSFYLTLDEL